METMAPALENSRKKWDKNLNYFPYESITPDHGLAVSEEEYWEKYYEYSDSRYEWNNGYLEVIPVTDYAGWQLMNWFCKILEQFLSTNPVGKMIGMDIGFRLAFPGKTSIRKPDLAVIMNDNSEIIHLEDCTYSGTYDLCIESLSYSNISEITRDTVHKKNEYQNIGVKEYYILDARAKETVFYRLDKYGNYKKIKPTGDIYESHILPGFRFRISDLYSQPDLIALTQDDVYSSYIMHHYQLEKGKYEKQKQRTLEAERRADQEKQRAERLAAKLKKLGISVDDI